MITFIVILSVLILVHEFGHFIFAKSQGVRVEKFSLGFGPRLFSRKFRGTEYMLCLIPFGGFIKMAGDNSEECKGAGDEFLSLGPGRRARIIFAGPFFNYVLAFLCLWMVYFLGFPKLTTVVGDLIQDMPGQAAGLQKGDKIVEIDGVGVEFWDDLTRRIHLAKDKPLDLKVIRDAKEFNLVLTPQLKKIVSAAGKEVDVGLIGIKPSDDVIKVRYTIGVALVKAFVNLAQMTLATLVSIFYIIIGAISFKESVTGPLGIFFITANAAKVGLTAIFHVMGILSMSLAVFNLLPLPILDGGHIFMAGLEKLRKRPLSRKLEDIINNIGMSFLIVLAIFIFLNDLAKYGYWDKILKMFGR